MAWMGGVGVAVGGGAVAVGGVASLTGVAVGRMGIAVGDTGEGGGCAPSQPMTRTRAIIATTIILGHLLSVYWADISLPSLAKSR
jgi:hypothetical protein